MAAAADEMQRRRRVCGRCAGARLIRMKLTRCSARRQERKRCRRRHPGHSRQALSGFEKMPMLEVVFDRLVRLLASSCATSVGYGGSEPVSITSLPFEDYLNSIPLPALLAVFRAWNGQSRILTFDSSQITLRWISPRPALHAPHFA